MRLLILGATGAVGSAVLAQALEDERIHRVIAPTRRPLAAHPKLENPVTDFSNIDPKASWFQVDAVICALGTTIKKAGSKQAFLAVDRDLALKLVGYARQAGARALALNSSLGASARGNFYLRSKFEIEQRMGELGFERYAIVRPSLINTQRAEVRRAEQLALWLERFVRPVIPKRYRSVTPQEIARELLSGVL